eukprot:NODE_5447_length_1769_cov_7.221681.p1 GENE.NODE_5447_length_1769_cov_7.221681~~NODE_5447_length_1769_cov_7.221681.p1  ORF type:complete len:491 (+),score=167.18 NODE_5447_length_1769_cov_7.221681:3-1475(+)
MGAVGGISRRERLENMMAREELKDSLVQKYRDRYGNGAKKSADEVSLASTTIRREVGRLVIATAPAPVTESNINKLERRLQRYANGADVDIISSGSISAYTLGSKDTSRSRSTQRRPRGTAVPATIPEVSMAMKPAASCNRGLSCEIRDVGVEAVIGAELITPPRPAVGDAAYASSKPRVGKRLSEAADPLMKISEDLNQQIAQRRAARAQDREDDKRYRMMQESAIDEWQEQERAVVVRQRERAVEARRELDVQIEASSRLKEEEKRTQLVEARQNCVGVRQSLVVDEQRSNELRVARREHAVKSREEVAIEAMKRQEQERLREVAEDRAIENYNRVKEAREQARKDPMLEKVHARHQLSELVGANLIANEHEREEELCKRVAVQRSANDAAAEKSVAAKAAELQHAREETRDYLVAQMAEKRRVKEKSVSLVDAIAAAIAEDVQDYAECEKSKEAERRSRNLQHRSELERQIAERAAMREAQVLPVFA